VAAAAPEIPEARWTELESRVASALGDGGPGPQAVKERIAAYRQQAPRWKEGCAREFGTKMKFLKGALWASDDFVDRFDIGHAYCAARLMMAKPAVVASIPGPTDVPIAPVLGGPVLGLRRGRAGVNREVHGVITGADGLWVELHMTSADSKPIAEPEAFVSGFFDTMRPFEHRPSDAAAVSQKLKLAQKESDPAARRKAALLSLASFHLDPKAKRAEHFVTAWAKKEPAPTQAELQTLVDQIATWIKAGPRARKELEDVIPKPK
jgi:hypothetical protein